MAEMLLYMAARAQLVEQVIKPALRAGKIVVSDRYLLANIVYQGYAGGLDVPQLWDLGNFVTGGVQPQLTFLLDMPPKAASDRIRRPLDRMEQQGEDFRERLRTGFLEEAKQHPEKIAVVDATRSIEDVHADIQRTAMALLE
jgi:dTMP kinase